MSTADWGDSPEFRRYAAHALEEMLPKLSGSEFCVSIAPSPGGEGKGRGDVKYWVELGASIMLDKPILVIAAPGQKLPERLRRVADEVFEVDWTSADAQQELAEKLAVYVEKDR